MSVSSIPVDVWADVFREGHDVIAAELLWRRERDTKWRRVAMQHQDNDRWHASFTPTEPGRYCSHVKPGNTPSERVFLASGFEWAASGKESVFEKIVEPA